jgi:hypothetical protein
MEDAPCQQLQRVGRRPCAVQLRNREKQEVVAHARAMAFFVRHLRHRRGSQPTSI